MLLEETTKLARDSFYVTVGFGVIGFQKLQVRRRELKARIERREHLEHLERTVDHLQSSISTGVSHLDDRVTSLERHVDPVIDDVEARLPSPTREIVHGARDAARGTRSQVVDLIARRGESPSAG